MASLSLKLEEIRGQKKECFWWIFYCCDTETKKDWLRGWCSQCPVVLDFQKCECTPCWKALKPKKKVDQFKMGVVILIDQKIQIQCALWDSNWNILWNIASKMHFMRVNISGVTIVMHKWCSKFLLLIQVERKRLDNLISNFLMWLDSKLLQFVALFHFC